MSENINGVPAAVAQILYDVVEEACVVVSAREPNEVFATVKGLDLAIGTDWSPSGATMTYEAPAKLFADAASFRAALEARTREARIAAFPALALLDERGAARLFDKMVRLDLSGSHQVSFEGNLVRAFWLRWKALSEYLPPATFGELFLRGLFAFASLTDEQVAAIPGDALIEALVSDSIAYPGDGDAERLARLHPVFADIDARGALAQRIAPLRGHFVRDLFPHLISGLIVAKHRSAEPAVLAYFERMGRTFPYGLTLVIAIGHEPTLARLFSELPALARRPGLRFDPHHTDSDLRPCIRAGYALDPATSSARFAPYFAPESVADDVGSKVAWDIWMLGDGRLVDHGGTRLGVAEGKILLADRGWAPIAARLANHPRLEKAARWVVAQTAEDPKELIAREALPASTWPSLMPKRGASKKTKPKASAKPKTPPKAKSKANAPAKTRAKPR